MVLIIAAISTGFALEGVTYLTLIVAALSLGITYLVVSFIYKHSQTAALKDDTLILNSMKLRSSVMSVSTVKRVKSRCLLGLCWTYLRYKIDGRTNWIFIVTSKLEFSPEYYINSAIEVKKENKKANHKPGSVITQQA